MAGRAVGQQVVALVIGCLCDTLSLAEGAGAPGVSAPPDLHPMALACLHGVLERALRVRDPSAHRALPRLLACLLRFPRTRQSPMRRILQLLVADDLNLMLTAAATAGLQEDAAFVEALIDLVPLKDLLAACRLNQAALRPALCVVRRLDAKQLAGHAPEIQSLLRDCVPGTRSEVPFLQLELFHALLLALKEADRESRGRRDLQDLAGVLVASVAGILANTAERQGGWFRASVACTEEEVAMSGRAARLLEQAMFLLLDHVFGPNGERADSLLTGPVLRAALPHLRLRPHPAVFDACSALLRELSRKEYTRRAWKKDVADLLLEAGFFRMPLATLRDWVAVVDNLMATEFKQAFRDIFPRLTVSTTANPFATRDQEWEQRSAMVRRLAFLIYCGELDQYLPQLQDVVAYLTENLRVSSAGHLHAAVMLCFRVLLSRISAASLAPLWYVFVPELYSALWQLDQEPEPQRLPQSRLDLYLAVFKLLDACMQLEEAQGALFHAYKWSLAGDPEDYGGGSGRGNGGSGSGGPTTIFVPLVNRVCRRICHMSNGLAVNNHEVATTNGPSPAAAPALQLRGTPPRSCCQRLTAVRIASLFDLLPFLVAFVERHDIGRVARQAAACPPGEALCDLPCPVHTNLPVQREEILLADFLEQ